MSEIRPGASRASRSRTGRPAATCRRCDGVDLAVRRGEILGIAGESGSGKSTLAVALLRLLKPPGHVTGGSAMFHPAGRSPVDLLKVDGEELRVLRWSALSYLPQGSMSSLNPVMRVAGPVQGRDPGTRAGPPGSLAELIPGLLAPGRAGAAGRPDVPARAVRRDEAAGADGDRVALEPDLVIADEPTTALDVTIQRVILQSLADLRDRLRRDADGDLARHGCARATGRPGRGDVRGPAGRGRRRTAGLQGPAGTPTPGS